MEPKDAEMDVIFTTDAIIASDRQVGVRRINQYQVFERIGRGMHGSVRKGKENTTGEFVVSLSSSLSLFLPSSPLFRSQYQPTNTVYVC